MRKVKIISLIGALLILIGVIGSVATFKTPTNRLDWQTLDQKIDINNINDIIISADNANIEVLAHANQTVNLKVKGNNPEEDVTTSVEGESLLIRLEHPSNKLFQFDFFSSVSSLKVYLPEKAFASLHVESDNGRIKVDEITAEGIRIKTNNGLIELQYLIAENVSVEAENGKISLEGVEGELYAETDNGAIGLITDDLDRKIELKTDIGTINIKASTKPTNAEINAAVDLGSISVFGKANASTIFGNGEYQINLTTNIGQIKVN